MEVSQQQKGTARETLRAAGHNQSRPCRSAPKSIPRLRGGNWRTAFSSRAGLSSLPEIDLEMRNHARDTWKEVFWWLLVKCILFAKGSQTFSSLWNIWCRPGNHHTTTRKILPWWKASIMDNRGTTQRLGILGVFIKVLTNKCFWTSSCAKKCPYYARLFELGFLILTAGRGLPETDCW